METKYIRPSLILFLISLLLFTQMFSTLTCFCRLLKTNVDQQSSAHSNTQSPFTGNSTIVLKVYPDNSSEILCTIELRDLNVSVEQMPRVNVNLTTRPLENGVRQDLVGFITIPEPQDPKTAELLNQMLLNLGVEGNGSRDEVSWQTSLNFSLPETVEIEATLIYYGNLTAGDSSLNVTATVTLYYQALNITKDQIQDFVDFWPMFKAFIEPAINIASEGLIRFEIDLEDPVIGDENATLTVLIRVSGKFIEGFEKMMENLQGMFIPGIQPEPLPEENRHILGNLSDMIKELTEIRYAWMTKFEGGLSWMPEEHRLLFSGHINYTGDLERQCKEALTVILEKLLKILPHLEGDGSVGKPPATEHMEQYLENLINLVTTSEFNVDWFSFSLKIEENYLRIEVSGIRVKPVQKILGFLGFVSGITPMENLTFIVQGSSDAEYMVEVEVPPEFAAEIAGPRRVEGRHRVIWGFRNLGAIEKLRFSRKPNVVGVIGFNYIEVEKTVNGVKHAVEIYTNSTVINASLLDNKLFIEVSGLEGLKGALNVTIPKSLVEGMIIVLIDGEMVEPKISYSGEEYSVYINYTHSLRQIEIMWAEPLLTITTDQNEANVGEEIEFSGILTLLEMPLAGETVWIMVDDSKAAESVTDSNGAYSVKLSFDVEGEHTVKAVYLFADQTFESDSLTLKIILPWYKNPYIIGGIVAVVVVIAVLTLILLRRKRTIS